MKNFTEVFGGKKVTVMGLGLLGRGAGDAKFLAECGAELIVTDLKSKEDLAPSLTLLADFPNISYRFGEHSLQDFRERDFILKAAGVPTDSPYIAEAKKQGIPVRMSADLFAEHSGIPVVGVTGTRGKTTVTMLIEAILRSAGKPTLLGGNIRGVSTLSLLKEVKGNEIAVLELDSWQLQGFGDAHMSPHISVFTTFFPDHLNYYHNDIDAYLADKANVFLNQREGDTLILGSQCAPLVQERYAKQFVGKFEIWGEHDLPADWKLPIPGAHNRYNASLALGAVRVLGVSDDVSRKAIESFTGAPGRLEFIAEKNGVKIYNDTNSTTPEATLAALEALAPAPIVLIMGGADKGLDMNKLLLEIPRRTKRIIMLAGTGTSRVLQFLPNASVFDSLEKAVDEAFLASSPGDAILFSPAFASFGMFTNEYDRGDQFNVLIRK